jgi:DNA-binding PadR family transcriptional regulator
MIQELLILGLLKEGSKHGYEIKKQIKEVLGPFAGLETKSIYYPLRTLARQKLLKRKRGKAGRRPEKYTYSLTPAGHRRFQELLNRNFLVIQRPFLNVDLSLFFLPYADKAIALRRLKSRLRGLKRIEKWEKEMFEKFKNDKDRYHLFAIIDHNLKLIKTEIFFTANLIEHLKKSHPKGQN